MAGVHPRVLANMPDGTLDLAQVEESIRPLNDHFPVSRLLCLENTHNKCGGRVIPAEYIDRHEGLHRSADLLLERCKTVDSVAK